MHPPQKGVALGRGTLYLLTDGVIEAEGEESAMLRSAEIEAVEGRR